MLRIILVILTGELLLNPPVFAQPDSLWTCTLGGSTDDWGASVEQTVGGGFIIAGTTTSYGYGSWDVYLIKTDESGNQLWSQTFGGPSYDYGHDVQLTSDGGYIVVGHTSSFSAGGYDVYLIKTDEAGSQIWSRVYGGNFTDWGMCVRQTTDGGYIITGATSSLGSGGLDVYLIKTDGLGEQIWSQTFGGVYDDWGMSVQQTTDGGYIIAGTTFSHGAGLSDVYLIKTDDSGTQEWSQTFGGGAGDGGSCVQQTGAGAFIVVGSTESYGAGLSDVYLIKTNASGAPLWWQTFGGENQDTGSSIRQTVDGGYIIAGSTASYGAGDGDVYLIKIDEIGNQVWSQTFGGSGDDGGNSVRQTDDEGYIVAGTTDSYGAGGDDVYLIRLADEITPVDPGHEYEEKIPKIYSLVPAFPNPFNTNTTIRFTLPEAQRVSLTVYNVSGRQVAELVNGWRNAGMHQVTFDGSNQASGIFVYRLKAGGYTNSGKIVLLK